jgi:hypothetical protein
MAHFEIQFTDGFSGQSMRMCRDSDVICETVLQTQFQTGLAHVEQIDADDESEIRICVEGADEAAITLKADRPFIVISLRGDELRIDKVADRPGYA